jgi:hypothetical protein
MPGLCRYRDPEDLRMALSPSPDAGHLRSFLAGARRPRLVEDTKAQAKRAFRRLERGLGDYDVKR